MKSSLRDEPFDMTSLRILYVVGPNLDTAQVAKLADLKAAGINTFIIPSQFAPPEGVAATGGLCPNPSPPDAGSLVEEPDDCSNVPSNSLLEDMKSNPTLSQFKLILDIYPIPETAYFQCVRNVCGKLGDGGRTSFTRAECPMICECDGLADGTKEALDAVLRWVRCKDSDERRVVGYYTFDEPALKGISHQYQKAVYDYIKLKESGPSARPVFIANTMYHPNTNGSHPGWMLTQTEITERLSPDVQDVILIDQYIWSPPFNWPGSTEATCDQQSSESLSNACWQKRAFDKWRTAGILQKPYILTLPSHRNVKPEDALPVCTPGDPRPVCNAETPCVNPYIPEVVRVTEEAIAYSFGSEPAPPSHGYAYFAFWPDPVPTNHATVENCYLIRDSTKEHLRVADHLDRTVAWRMGHVNEDRKTDLIQIWDNLGSAAVSVYTSTGSSYASTWTTTTLGEGIPAIDWLTGDVNADGKTDLIQSWDANGRLALNVFTSDGKGFTRAWRQPNMQEGPGPLLTGDVNGDDRTDLIQPWNHDGHLALILYTSSGYRFDQTWNNIDTGVAFSMPMTARMNAGKETDLIQPRQGNNGHLVLSVYLASSGQLIKNSCDFDTGKPFSVPMLGDVNMDGKTDVIQTRDNGSGQMEINVYVSDGACFTAWSPFQTGEPFAPLLLGDVNHDQAVDLIQPKNNNGTLGLIIYTSTGSGFNKTTVPSTGQGWPAVARFTADINGDERSDLVHLWNDNGKLGLLGYLSDGSSLSSASIIQ